MKKILSTILSLCLIMCTICIFVSAKDLSDGTYEVDVTLMHKKDEKESTGNKYIAQKALLEVKNGEKAITLLLDTDMSGIAFSYYLDGSIEGEAAEAEKVSNVSVDGKTYEQGFVIPVVKDGDIGLKFSVPVMPMSPSARLRIDYSGAVLVREAETTVGENVAATSAIQNNDTTTTETTLETTSEAAVENTTTQPSTASTVTTTAPTTAAVVPQDTAVKQESKMTPAQLIMMLAFILGACVLAILAVSKREDELI